MSNSYNWTSGHYPNGHMSSCPIGHLDIVGFGQYPISPIGQLDICPNPIGQCSIGQSAFLYIVLFV